MTEKGMKKNRGQTRYWQWYNEKQGDRKLEKERYRINRDGDR